MKTRIFGLLIVQLLAMGGGVATAAEADTVPREAVEEIIREYILKHPEVILDSIRGLQERERKAQSEQSRQAITDRRAELLNDPKSPVAGNHAGDVTVVEFFDYRCPYCKAVAATLKQLVQNDPSLRVVFKEFPILGEQSTLAAKAALAAHRQGKYVSFHHALMESREPLNESVVLGIAAETGLDVNKMRAEMQDPEVASAIQQNQRLAQAIGITGTPAFIIGDALVRGSLDLDALKELIARARSKRP
jgi:protein-disulfide isomerase